MRRKTIIAVLGLIAVALPAASQDDPKLQAALKELEAFRKEILDANATKDKLYGYPAAAKTLQDEFDRLGSKATYPDWWAQWLHMQVNRDNGFLTNDQYRSPLASVQDSLAFVTTSRVVLDEDMAYMRSAMADYRKARDTAFDLLARKVKNYAQRGLKLDEGQVKALDTELEDLNKRIDALLVTCPIASLRVPAFAYRVERKEGLLMGLKHILAALELQAPGAIADRAFWQTLPAGAPFLTLDSARISAVSGRRTLPAGATVTWFVLRDGAWRQFGTGAHEFRLPIEAGTLPIFGQLTINGRLHLMPRIDFTVQKSASQAFWIKILTMTGDAIYWYRDAAKKGVETYAELWAKDPAAPTTLPMTTDRSGRAHAPASGDIVLRTAGLFSQAMFVLGSPDSPQLHAGILKLEVFRNAPVHLVHQVNVLGYEVVPLTPADAALYQQMKGLAVMPRSFMDDANVGSVEIHRPIARDGDGKLDAHYNAAAGNRAPVVGGTVKGYDYGFLESSEVAGSLSEQMYCNEFVRECLGREVATPAENPLLREFWTAALAYDKEAAQKRFAAGPSELLRLLGSTNLDAIAFDAGDAAKDQALRDQVRTIIATLNRLLSGTSFRDLVVEKAAAGVREKFVEKVSTATGVPQPYVPLLSVLCNPTLRAWMQVGENAMAESLVREMEKDLGDALGTGQLLKGGRVTYDEKTVNVIFTKISR